MSNQFYTVEAFAPIKRKNLQEKDISKVKSVNWQALTNQKEERYG